MTHPVIYGQGVRLCPTSPDDLGALTRLFSLPDVQSWWPTGPNDIAAKYIGARSPWVECFLVRGTGGDILGFVQYHVAENGAEGGGLDLVVTPAARRHGVGRATATAVVAFLRRERGWNRVTVDPDLSNERGTAFWQAVGFAIEEQVDNDPTRGPYLIMQATAQVEG